MPLTLGTLAHVAPSTRTRSLMIQPCSAGDTAHLPPGDAIVLAGDFKAVGARTRPTSG
ncbi:hypothetical protein [Candidatus Amarobacter glycogenicus]|uniref:hypothetical protein n=1 Tax=Candidatus Amarobacter glycogenicus TaxID=3140699 RepID=UPI002A0E4571|nr:hypothetical protein [Dehalococcoidia bacterium]